MGKNIKNNSGFVFSTNPDFELNKEDEQTEETPNNQQKLRVHLMRLKGNKEATVVMGFIGSEDSIELLAKLLKSKCGVGGSAKDGEILIQGNQRDKVVELLIKEGFSQTKKAGG
jgi:translation initiation factor 1